MTYGRTGWKRSQFALGSRLQSAAAATPPDRATLAWLYSLRCLGHGRSPSSPVDSARGLKALFSLRNAISLILHSNGARRYGLNLRKQA